MPYVDGFVVPVPKARLEDYWKLARESGAVWKEHGALKVVEAVADDVRYGEITSFPRAVQVKEDEVVVFSFIAFQSRAHRDEVNKKVMEDPRIKDQDTSQAPFDAKRMIYGGFEVAVDL
ncbi:MAG TPA: DUF1428 domain-containing protein [Paracoccaceae bacterium]|nr:DUF1428 domain-containing protein [Paracoccaceae bacterium]